MCKYQRVNLVCGFISFVISAVVYILTVEPSASFWDCPEFILSASRLEVGHPPGAPFFMLAGNVFSLFASSPQDVAYCINVMNALLSAGCIFFLFLTITYLVSSVVCNEKSREDLSNSSISLIMLSGFTGALLYAFTDTFWFSAVEGEVYSFSSFLTALTVWIILKWDEEAASVSSDRWIVLMAYIIGLSIGVHLLNLLCIPAVGLVVYYRKFPHTGRKGLMISLILSIMVIALVLYGIVPGVMKVAGLFEMFFANTFDAGYDTGMTVYAILLFVTLLLACVSCVVRRNIRIAFVCIYLSLIMLGVTFHGKIWLSLCFSLLLAFIIWVIVVKNSPDSLWRISYVFSFSLLMLTVGYSSYALILIRSSANTPMDQQSPQDPFTLRDYLGREQYGDTPLLYGPSFASVRALKEKDGYLMYDYKVTDDIYRRKDWTTDTAKTIKDEKYVVTGQKLKPEYEDATCMFFPRMYSEDHAEQYKAWIPGGMKGKQVSYFDKSKGERVSVTVPTFIDNLKYFLNYQVSYMYLRYFFWNFVGRQNDIQGFGDKINGNWITGFSFIDRFLVADNEFLPSHLKDNHGRNVYYALPLIFGLLGIWWQWKNGTRGRRQFNVVAILFFMTGLAIVLYLNQVPVQPRERDYAYAGSFYAFSVWIGLGAVAFFEILGRIFRTNKSIPALVVASAACAGLVLLVLTQTWDDHDRSDRYLCRDMGYNYLNTVQDEGYPVLFVNGDNETFPLWYAQEVEGVRTDVRVCNLMYLTGGWYVDQMCRPSHSSPGLPVSFSRDFYRDGVNDVVRVNPLAGYSDDGSPVHIKDKIEEYYNTHPGEHPFGEDPWEWKNIVRYWLTSDDESMRCIPTDEIHFRVDADAVKRSGMYVPEGMKIPETMVVSLKNKSYLTRSGIILADLISNCNWERPLYVAKSMRIGEYLDLDDYLVLEGMAQRIVPYNARKLRQTVDADRCYDNIMNKYSYGNLSDNSVYFDETNRRMAITMQRMIYEAAEWMHSSGDSIRSSALADKCLEEISNEDVLFDCYSCADRLALLSGSDRSSEVYSSVMNERMEYALWYLTFGDNDFPDYMDELLRTLYNIDPVCVGKEYDNILNLAHDRYSSLGLDEYAKFVEKLRHERYSPNG